MKRVFWLIPDLLAGRPGPRFFSWKPAELRAGGFDAVLNLSEYEPETAALEAAGLRSYWVPLPMDYPPSGESEQQCIEALPRALDHMNRELAAGRRTLVHCFAGRDRTGMLLALFLARRDGLAAADAIARVRKVRPEAISAPGWEEMALRVITRLAAAPG
jgi:protein-tyrosine phosphatase